MTTQKKYFTSSNIITALMVVFALGMMVSPGFKAVVIQGLMKVGLFKPSIEKVPAESVSQSATSYNINFYDDKGASLNSDALKGKVVFLNFWATWCPPCIAEMPSVNELYNAFKQNPGIAFILVDADSDLPKANNFMLKKEFQLPVYKTTQPIPAAWYEGSLPTTVVLNKAGNVVYKHTGAADYNSEKFHKFLNDLIAENADQQK